MEDTGTSVCYRHPDRATRLSCSNCGRPICGDCSRDAAVGQRCPECARPEGRHRVVTARQAFGPPTFATAPVTFTIIGICALVFLLNLTMSPLELRVFQSDWALYGPLVRQGEWWRVITAAFLHAGWTHILLNMYAIYVLAPRLERETGSVGFALLYLASAVGGGYASTMFGPEALSLGASGAVFGLFGAWLFVALRLRNTAGGRALLNQFLFLLILNAALPLLVRGIDWRAHLGGLVTGLLVAAAWSRFAAGRPNATRNRAVVACVILAAALALVILA
jgi:membrane associated rhomboid family serine protease